MGFSWRSAAVRGASSRGRSSRSVGKKSLINTSNGVRIYGNGILSSYGEVTHCLGDDVQRLPFEPQRMAEQPADLSIMQPVLFVIDSFEQLESEFDRWAKSLGLSTAQ